MGRFKWLITQETLEESFCLRSGYNETELHLEASVTNVENGQLVRAVASTIINPQSLRMGFSLPSPAVILPDMPLMAWVIIGSSSL